MPESTPLVLPFSAIRAADLPLVGGKGANLGEMAAAGFPIPPGFCLTTAAFRRFVDACPHADALYAELDALTADDLDAVRDLGARLRAALLETPIPADLRAAALDAWGAAGPEAAYAVRSSATAEDLPGASFAGQQDTYLNVRGEDALLDAIRRCWASLFTDRAILYRIQNGFDHRQVALSVVVQQMVMAEKSGIMFTADPVSGHRHTLTIDASFGLGEALVSGLVTPDTYHVDKRTGEIIRREIAEKEIAILPLPDGGTQQVTLPPEQRTQPALTDEQIRALAELGARIEAHYGQPQDIEWAISPYPSPPPDGGRVWEGGIYILQSRPITSLYPIDGLTSPDGTLHVYFSMGHQQNMTRAMMPLSLSSFHLLAGFLRPAGADEVPYIRTSGGRLFADITQPLRHPIFRRVVFGLTAQFDAQAPQMLKQVMTRPEFRGEHGIRVSFGFIKGALGIVRRLLQALWRADLTGFVARTNALMDDYVADFRRRLQAVPPGRPRLEIVRDTLPGLFAFFLNWVPEAAAGVAVTRLLPRLARRYLSPEETEALTLGIPGNVVNEMNLAISDLADLARRSPALVAHFERLGDDAHAWLSAAADLPDSAPFLDGLADFLSKYGARGPSEIDIAAPRWHEDPLPLLQVIAAQLDAEPGAQRARWRAMEAGRQAAFEKLLAAAGRGPLGGLRRRLFRRLYHVMTEVGGMREHHKFLAVRILWEVKQVLYPALSLRAPEGREAISSTDQEIASAALPPRDDTHLSLRAPEGREAISSTDQEIASGAAHPRNDTTIAEMLVAAGKLDSPDDIWFLRWPELLSIWDDDATDWRVLVARRRAEQERYQKLNPPVIITSDGETPVISWQVADLPPGALAGMPVSAGVVEGVAHVVRDPQREQLAHGDILVAAYTDPGWTPLFINAAGLVLEIGGTLSHGSVVAREYGIPAVVGVRQATTKIRTGQRLRVDGDRGVVEILD